MSNLLNKKISAEKFGLIINLLIVLIIVVFSLIIFNVMLKNKEHTKSSEFFSEGSEQFLGKYKLDLPEEISTVTQFTDTVSDLMIASLDTTKNTIYLSFSGYQLSDNQLLINNRYTKSDMFHYQIYLDTNSMILYDHGRIIGRMPYGDNSPLDSLITLDNQ